MPEPGPFHWAHDFHRRPETTRTLVLLHGFAGTRRDWDPFHARLAPHHHLATLDLPDHGESADLPNEPPDAFAWIADALATWAKKEGYAPAVWLGYSYGARIAEAVAAHRPDAVAGLVLESGHPGFAEPAQRASRRALDEADAKLLEAEGIDAFLESWHARPVFQTRREQSGWRAEVERKRRTNRASALARSLRRLGVGAQPDYAPAITNLGRPVLLLTGALDRAYGVLAQNLTRRAPHIRHEIVPGAGHAPHLEAPDRFLQVVNDFLDAPGGP